MRGAEDSRLDLAGYVAAWNLSSPTWLASTPTSEVYRVDLAGDAAVLKLLTPLGVADESCGATALRIFNGDGAVRLIRADARAHLVEYAEGPDLIGVDDDRAAELLAEVLVALGGARAPHAKETLWSLQRRFRSLFEHADRAQRHGAVIGRRHDVAWHGDGGLDDNAARLGPADVECASQLVHGADVARALLEQPESEGVLHGDLHHANVRFSPRGVLAIDPKGLYGERAYEAANLLCNPLGSPGRVHDADRLRRHARR